MNKGKPKVFISHSWEDNEISRKLAEYLRRDGAEVWIDYARIEGGDNLPEIISNAIDWCDTLLLVWSKSAIESYWVKEEWTCAHSLRKRIVPCLIDKSKLPSILMSRLHINVKNFDKGYPDLSRALKLIIERKKSSVTKERSEPELEIIKQEITIFRSNPIELSEKNVKIMLKKNGFYSKQDDWNRKFCNPLGKGFDNKYKTKAINQEKIVIDNASELMWQKSGSQVEGMEFEDAKKWVKELNQKEFAGFNDWRLPTLEEGMSLVEPVKNNKGLYIDSIFDNKQVSIWTADLVKGEGLAWVVGFYDAVCYYYEFGGNSGVRAVRSAQLSQE